jgi:response regulator RpfG family c-di-GMP phosphodiesterase
LAAAGAAADLDGLLAALESWQPHAAAHGRRVARWAGALARALRLSPGEIADVEGAALLHDIGKLALPGGLLDSPEPLGDAEVAVVRGHVAAGYGIVSAVPSLRPAARLLLAVHERWDGEGYPAGLSGRDIPLGARIVAVADAFDALSAPCVWRDPLSRDDASAEIVRSAGAQFDPDVVRAWLRTVEAVCS